MKVIPNDNTGLWEIHDDAGFICKLESAFRFQLTAQLFRSAPELLSALNAIVARIQGEWDQPDLIAYGPLHTSSEHDCERIARAAIAKATTNERK